jgi:hypothetical protein
VYTFLAARSTLRLTIMPHSKPAFFICDNVGVPLRFNSTRLLRAIFEKTGGPNRAVRDVVELNTGLTVEECRSAWRDLIEAGLILRFSADYAARLSPAGVELIRNAPVHQAAAGLGKAFLVHGQGTQEREAVAQLVQELGFEPILLHDRDEQGRTVMEQVNSLREGGFAIALLTQENLPPNALLELGFLLGHFGLDQVLALVGGSAAAPPADLPHVAWTALDAPGDWKSWLQRNLLASQK